MFAVGLREHHQFDVARVALQPAEGRHQVVDLVVRQRQTELAVGLDQRLATRAQHVDVGQGLGLSGIEKVGSGFALEGDVFGHAVVQRGGHGPAFGLRQGLARPQQAGLHRQAVLGDTLHPVQGHAAVACNVGGLAGPGADRAQPRHHEHEFAVDGPW
jgi:hypothetical protein